MASLMIVFKTFLMFDVSPESRVTKHALPELRSSFRSRSKSPPVDDMFDPTDMIPVGIRPL